jgi:hypothetical protein
LRSDEDTIIRYKDQFAHLAREISAAEEILQDQLGLLNEMHKTVGQAGLEQHSEDISLDRECDSSIVLNSMLVIQEELDKLKEIKDDIEMKKEEVCYTSTSLVSVLTPD